MWGEKGRKETGGKGGIGVVATHLVDFVALGPYVDMSSMAICEQNTPHHTPARKCNSLKISNLNITSK